MKLDSDTKKLQSLYEQVLFEKYYNDTYKKSYSINNITAKWRTTELTYIILIKHIY
jgi:hypothetical protein